MGTNDFSIEQAIRVWQTQQELLSQSEEGRAVLDRYPPQLATYVFGPVKKLINITQPEKVLIQQEKFSKCTWANLEGYLSDYLTSLLQKHELIIRPWGENIDSLRITEIVPLKLIDENEGKIQETTNENMAFFNIIEETQKSLIIGDPGSGKSTFLQWVNFNCAKQILSSHQENIPVPVYLELKWYENDLSKLAVNYFEENKISCNEEIFEAWMRKGHFIFLLDGFDDIGDLSSFFKNIKRFMGFSEKNKFIITSRELEVLSNLEALGFKKVRINPFSDPQIRLFIGRYLSEEEEEKLLTELEKQNLLNEARNPLMLWFMILEYRKDRSTEIHIKNRGLLFKNIIEGHFLKWWETKIEVNTQKIDLKIEILSKLAFSMIKEEDSVKVEEDKAKNIIDTFLKEGRINYKDIRDEILRQSLLHHILIKRDCKISFWHKSFRDYFASLELMNVFLKSHNEFTRYATKKWEDSIIFLAGIVDDPSILVNQLIKSFRRHFLNYLHLGEDVFKILLAAKCIGASNKISAETEQKVIKLSQDIIQVGLYKGKLSELIRWFFPISFMVYEAFQSLGNTKSEKAADFLWEFLKNKDCRICEENSCYFCQCAIDALRSTPLTEKTQNLLLKIALYFKDGIARHYAMEVLSRSMLHQFLYKLAHIIKNGEEEYKVREHALDILRERNKKLKNEYPDEIVDILIRLVLEEKHEIMRLRAANTLGFCNRGKDNVVSPLIRALLENPDANTRTRAAYALIYHSNPEVREALIQALDDKDTAVCMSAAHALVYNFGVKTPEERRKAANKLSKMFDNEDIYVIQGAVWAYSHIAIYPSNEEISKLINLLRDENITIRAIAAEALGSLKIGNAFSELKNMIENEKYLHPWSSAIQAIQQIEPTFSEVIKRNLWEFPHIYKLYDEDLEERRFAVFVLGKIGTEISLPHLKKFKDDRERSRGIDTFNAIWNIENRMVSQNN